MVASPIRRAYDALMAGDIDPLVGLLDDRLDWRGRRRWLRPWRNRPG